MSKAPQFTFDPDTMLLTESATGKHLDLSLRHGDDFRLLLLTHDFDRNLTDHVARYIRRDSLPEDWRE